MGLVSSLWPARLSIVRPGSLTASVYAPCSLVRAMPGALYCPVATFTARGFHSTSGSPRRQQRRASLGCCEIFKNPHALRQALRGAWPGWQLSAEAGAVVAVATYEGNSPCGGVAGRLFERRMRLWSTWSGEDGRWIRRRCVSAAVSDGVCLARPRHCGEALTSMRRVAVTLPLWSVCLCLRLLNGSDNSRCSTDQTAQGAPPL